MQLAYLDESANDDYYYVTALIVEDHDVVGLSSALQKVADHAWGTYAGVPYNPELHAHAIANGKEDWASIAKDYEAQKDVLNRAMDVIADHEVAVYIRGVHRAKYQARYGTDIDDMHGTALTWTLERVQRHAARSNTVSLVIADERRGPEARYREALRTYQTYGTYGWKPEKLDRIIDTIHFAPSKESRLLQAADVVSWAHVRSLGKYKNEALREFQSELWGRLTRAGRVNEASAWEPWR